MKAWAGTRQGDRFGWFDSQRELNLYFIFQHLCKERAKHELHRDQFLSKHLYHPMLMPLLVSHDDPATPH